MTPWLRRAVAAVRSVTAYVVVSGYVLLVTPPGMLIAWMFGTKGLLYVLGHIGVWLGLTAAGIKYRVAGREHVVAGGAAVYCANHQSNVDPPVLFRSVHPRLHVLFKAELKDLPLLGRALPMGGFVPIQRGNREQSRAAIEEGARSLRQGNSFLIFPEGTRSRTGDMLPFKKGGFVMAIKAQAPIVPVAVQGGRDAMAKGSRIIRPVTVSVRIGRPISTIGMTLTDRERLVAVTRAEIARMLAMGPIA